MSETRKYFENNACLYTDIDGKTAVGFSAVDFITDRPTADRQADRPTADGKTADRRAEPTAEPLTVYNLALICVRKVLKDTVVGCDKKSPFKRAVKEKSGEWKNKISTSGYDFAWDLYNNARASHALLSAYSQDVQDLINTAVVGILTAKPTADRQAVDRLTAELTADGLTAEPLTDEPTADGLTDGDRIYAGIVTVCEYIRSLKNPYINNRDIFLEDYITDRPTDEPTADGLTAEPTAEPLTAELTAEPLTETDGTPIIINISAQDRQLCKSIAEYCKLTTRQTQVLNLLRRNYNTRNIAERLHITDRRAEQIILKIKQAVIKYYNEHNLTAELTAHNITA